MIGFDTNIVIYALNGHPEFARASQAVLSLAKGEGAVISTILQTEVLAVSDGRPATDVEQIQQFLSQLEGVVCNPVDSGVAVYAAELLRLYAPRLKIVDALHLATAKIGLATTFYTNDKKLVDVHVPGLEIALLQPDACV